MRYLRALATTLAASAALATLVNAQAIPLDALMRGGRIHYDGGRYERAVEQFTRALEEYGDKADAGQLADIHRWLGLSKSQLREFSAAADHFIQAIGADSTITEILRTSEQEQYWSWTALINSARANYNSGDYETSLGAAIAASMISPDKSGAYSLIANSYSALERYEEMLSTARSMLELDAQSPEAFSLIGLYFLQQPDNQWPEGMRLARWDSCAVYYRQAIGIYQSRYDEAVEVLGEKLSLQDSVRLSRIARDLVILSRATNQEGLRRYIEQDLDAADLVSEIAQVASRLFYSANNLNVSASRAGSAMLRAASELEGEKATSFRDQAARWFEDAVSFDANDYAALFNLGIVQYQAQQDSEALATFQRVAEGTVVPLPRLPDRWRLELCQMITAAAAAVGHMVLSEPTQGTIDSVLADLGHAGGGFRWLYFPELRKRSDFTGATAADAGGMTLSSQSPPALENVHLLVGASRTGLGMARRDAGRLEEARALFEQAIADLLAVTRLNPANAEAYRYLVDCYRETQRNQQAEEAYKTYKKLTGN